MREVPFLGPEVVRKKKKNACIYIPFVNGIEIDKSISTTHNPSILHAVLFVFTLKEFCRCRRQSSDKSRSRYRTLEHGNDRLASGGGGVFEFLVMWKPSSEIFSASWFNGIEEFEVFWSKKEKKSFFELSDENWVTQQNPRYHFPCYENIYNCR